MSFQVGIDSLVGTVFFQAGLCTPVQAMDWNSLMIFAETEMFRSAQLHSAHFISGVRLLARYVAVSDAYAL